MSDFGSFFEKSAAAAARSASFAFEPQAQKAAAAQRSPDYALSEAQRRRQMLRLPYAAPASGLVSMQVSFEGANLKSRLEQYDEYFVTERYPQHPSYDLFGVCIAHAAQLIAQRQNFKVLVSNLGGLDETGKEVGGGLSLLLTNKNIASAMRSHVTPQIITLASQLKGDDRPPADPQLLTHTPAAPFVSGDEMREATRSVSERFRGARIGYSAFGIR